MTHNAGRAAALTPRVRLDPEVQHLAALYVASRLTARSRTTVRLRAILAG